MGTTTANMSLQKPTLGGDSGTWDDQLNASLDLVDLHDHSSGKGVRIPAGGLNITGDLTFNGTAALLAAKAVGFTAQASYTTARSLFVRSSDNELMWRSHAGADIQITSGATLNLSLVGGITGDYAAASASFYYDDANETYRALNAAPLPNDWARIAAGDVDLYENGSGITTRVRLSSPAGLAGSYALTFPAALPGSTSLLTVSSAGAIAATNTLSQSVAFNAGLTVPTGQHITLAGTSTVKHDVYRRTMPMVTFISRGLAGTGSYDNGSWVFTTTPVECDGPVPVYVGERIRSFFIYGVSDGSGVLQAQLFYSSTTAAHNTGEALSADLDTGGAGAFTALYDIDPDLTVADGDTYYLRLAGDGGVRVHSVQVVYDRV